jgi:hypothetical protein
LKIGFVLHNLIFLVERIATEATARPLAATKSEAQNPKPETNPNDQKTKIQNKTPKSQTISGGAEKLRLSIKGRSCAFGTKIVVFEYAAF